MISFPRGEAGARDRSRTGSFPDTISICRTTGSNWWTTCRTGSSDAVMPSRGDRVGGVSQGHPPAPLSSEEEAAVSGAVARRREEFARGRECAHLAMRQLGVRDVALVPGPGRAPVWPDGIITYCEGYSAAAVTTTHRFVGLGIDTEPPARTPRPRSTQPCATTRSWSTCRLRNRTRC